jgi:hypothetical protein
MRKRAERQTLYPIFRGFGAMHRRRAQLRSSSTEIFTLRKAYEIPAFSSLPDYPVKKICSLSPIIAGRDSIISASVWQPAPSSVSSRFCSGRMTMRCIIHIGNALHLPRQGYAHQRTVGSFWHRRCGIGDGSIRCAVATEVPKHDTKGQAWRRKARAR